MDVKFKYITEVNNKQKFAEMHLYDEISDEKVNGRHFASELNYLLDYENFKEIRVRINSVGGSVMHAFSIFSAIINANKRTGVNVNTYNDGVAASSAGFILMAGAKVYVKDYSRLMLHGVSIPDSAELTESDKAALDNFEQMIISVFHKKTGVPESYFKDLLGNGKDNWFNAEEGAKAGFYDKKNIENTGFEIDLPEDLSLAASMVANKAKKIMNINKDKPLQMKKIISALKLQEGSSEEVVLAAVQNAIAEASRSKTALEEAENKLTKKDAEIEALKKDSEKAVQDSALSIVENAIKEGKFAPKDEDEKSKLVETATKDLESFKNMISLMPTKAANIYDGGKNGNSGEEATGLLEKVKNRSFRTLEKEEPKLLNEIKNSFKSEYVKLYNKEYGTEKTEADF